MSKLTSAKTNKRIRALIKEGFAYSDIAKECDVSPAHVQKQAVMLEALGQFKRVGRAAGSGKGGAESLARHGSAHFRALALFRGCDADDAGIDLVSLFNTPRTAKQIKRFWSGE